MAEANADIQVFNETSHELPVTASDITRAAGAIAREENCGYSFVEIVFVDEDEIIRINKEHLGRDYVTDIISFRYDESEHDSAIEGTLFCCAPRIIEQAQEFNQSAATEFRRIVIHGLLHLAGYEDSTEDQKQQMTRKEDTYLSLSSS